MLDSLFVSDDTPYLSQIRFEEEFIDPATLNPNYTSDIVQKNMQELANIVNADDIVSVAAKLYSGNNTYLLGMDAAKFNDKWYLLNAQGFIKKRMRVNTFHP